MKKLVIAVFCIIIVSFIANNLFASTYTVEDPGYANHLVSLPFRNRIKDIWATVAVLVQIVSVACVVFAGLRYMFASADQKADIKQGLTYMVIGAMFVFCTVTIIQFVSSAAEEIL